MCCLLNFISFSLKQIHRFIFNEFEGSSLQSIQLQNTYVKGDSTDIAVINIKNANFLILYNLQEGQYYKLAFNIRVIIPHQITIRNGDELLMVDVANRLWAGDLSRIKLSKNCEKCRIVNVSLLGSLLGYSNALAVSSMYNTGTGVFNDYLYYYLPRDGAIVRWNFRYVYLYFCV